VRDAGDGQAGQDRHRLHPHTGHRYQDHQEDGLRRQVGEHVQQAVQAPGAAGITLVLRIHVALHPVVTHVMSGVQRQPNSGEVSGAHRIPSAVMNHRTFE
jgi:hypothetical protein